MLEAQIGAARQIDYKFLLIQLVENKYETVQEKRVRGC